MGKYMVTGEYVTVKTATADGLRIVGLYRGAALPGDASPETVQHLLGRGLIAEVDEAEDELQAEPGEVTTDTGSEPGAGVPVVEQPAGNASRDDWAVYAESRGAPGSETAPVADGGLGRDELREKYGS